jgi:hypothetical protein
MRRVTDLFAESRQTKLPKLPGRGGKGQASGKRAAFDASKTVLLRQHFLWLLGEVVHSFENSNSGPDGLAFWNELGFTWGTQVRETLSLNGYSNDRALFSRRSPEQKRELVARAKREIEIITHFLLNYGVADVRAQLEVGAEPTDAKRYRDGRFCVKVDATKHGRGGRSDDLFAVFGHQTAEAEFFDLLRKGGDLTRTVPEFRATVEKAFHDLFEHALDFKVSPLDWFLIGTYKAMASGALRRLRFDPWIDRCDTDEPGHADMLRQSIHTEVLVADKNYFRINLHYSGRGVHDPGET